MLGQNMAGLWAAVLQQGPVAWGHAATGVCWWHWWGQEVAGTGLGTLGHRAARGVRNACVRFPDSLITSGQGATSQPLASVGLWWCGIYYCYLFNLAAGAQFCTGGWPLWAFSFLVYQELEHCHCSCGLSRDFSGSQESWGASEEAREMLEVTSWC